MSRHFTARPINASQGDLETNEYQLIESKSVYDFDGFLTDYTMYKRLSDGMYVFVFGDNDLYHPEERNHDFECETEEEAYEWFESYEGYIDDEE